MNSLLALLQDGAAEVAAWAEAQLGAGDAPSRTDDGATAAGEPAEPPVAHAAQLARQLQALHSAACSLAPRLAAAPPAAVTPELRRTFLDGLNELLLALGPCLRSAGTADLAS